MRERIRRFGLSSSRTKRGRLVAVYGKCVINLKMTTHPAFFICGSIAFSGKLTQMSALPVGQPHNGKYVSICTMSSQQPVSLRYAAMFRLPAWGSKPRVSIALFRCVRTEAKAEIRNVHGEVIAQLGEAGCD